MWNDLIGGAADRQRERATPSHGSFCFSTSYLLSGFEYETNDFLDFKQLVSVKKNIYIYVTVQYLLSAIVPKRKEEKLTTHISSAMAPTPDYQALDSTILRRSLTNVNHTQAVTLGIIAVYVVVIALLWNLPYVRWSLWPFKVCRSLTT